MHRFVNFLICISLLIPLITGCSKSANDPVLTDLPENRINRDGVSSVHQCLGYYEFNIDAESLTATAVPIRSGSWHFNMTGVLNSTMGVSVAGVPGEADPANGLFVFDITLTHPFGDKPQFSGFDVKGILMTPGTLAVGPLVFAGADEIQLENADGFTRWWNPVEFPTPGVFGYTEGSLPHSPSILLSATVNPYKLYADILGPTDSLAWAADEPLDSDQGRAVFRAGSSNTRRYYIRFPMDPGPQVVFGYAVDCSWNLPAPNPPAEVPDDFPMEANQPEAWRVSLIPTANTLYYDSDADPSPVAGGVLRLQVNIHDWQGQALGNTQDEISAVRFFAPDLMSGGVDGVFLNEIPTKARYTADLTGPAVPSGAGEVQVICRVESSDGNYAQAAAPAPDSPISAFQVLTLDIPDPECSPDANNDWLEAFDIGFGDWIADQVCLPSDYRDFYTFEVPIGSEITGTIELHCDAEPTELGLYTSDQVLVDESAISAGYASVSLDALDLTPGAYFIRVWTSNDTQVSPYLLEMNAELVDVSPNLVDITPGNLYMEPNWLWLHEDILYLLYRGMWAYDMSDPSNPVFMGGRRIPGFSYLDDADLNYPCCYFTYHLTLTPSRLCLVDFSDPSDPVLNMDLLEFESETRAMCMNSTHVYVALEDDADPNILIYDYTSDPLAPVLVGETTVPEIIRDLGLIDPEGPDTQLVVGALGNLHFLGVEDPGAITDEGSVPLYVGFQTNDLVVDGEYIYVVDDDSVNGWIDIYRQSDTGPILEGSDDLPGGSKYIDVQYPYAYVGDSDAGLTVVDVDDPAAPSDVISIPLVAWGMRVAVDDDYVCINPQYSTIQVFDITTPTAPVELTHLWSANRPKAQFIFEGDYLIAIDETAPSAIEVIDISDPPDATIVAENQIPDYPRYMVKEGDLIAYSFGTSVRCVYASDIMNMVPGTGSYDVGDTVDALAIFGNYLYAAYDAGSDVNVTIISIADPDVPDYVGWFHYDSNDVREITIAGTAMYFPCDDGVQIYSLGNPSYPDYIGLYATVDEVFELDVQGDYLYIFIADPGILEIADISDPLAPVSVGSGYIGVANHNNVAVDGQYAYFGNNLSTETHGVLIYPPGTVTPLGVVYPGDYQCDGLYVNEGYLYKKTQGFGISIFDLY